MKKTLIFLISIFELLALIENIYAQQIFIRDAGIFKSNTDPTCVSNLDMTRDLSLSTDTTGPRIEFNTLRAWSGNTPGSCIAICAKFEILVQELSTGTTFNIGVDELSFEIVRLGGNLLDPSSTPPIRTISINDSNKLPNATFTSPGRFVSNYVCANWQGEGHYPDGWYKRNGYYGNIPFGVRIKARTNRVSTQTGNINIETTIGFPGDNRRPIEVDVMDIHTVKATPTVVGQITGVGAQPYNILYRLSKDATVSIYIDDFGGNRIRNLLDSVPRFGEGFTNENLTNGDFWDARDNEGRLVQPGTYRVKIKASALDNYGWDESEFPISNSFTMSIDPLQITDIRVKDLGPLATDVAIISFMLTEDATVYLDIYPSGTQFNNINCANRSTLCGPTLNGNSVNPLRSYMDTKPRRQTVSFYWDGKDENGRYLCDGQYVFALSAETPGRGGMVRTQRLSIGTVSIAKGDPLAFLNPSTTVIGSSPTAAGLNPFFFRFQLQRPADVRLEIRDTSSSNSLIRTLLPNDGGNSYEPLSSGITHTIIWDGRKSDGSWASTGTYRANLIVKDPHSCASNNIFTHSPDFNVNLFRIVDVEPKHIIGMSTMASVSYQLSQSMWVDFKIYKPDFDINPSQWPWESGSYIMPQNIVYSISGMRPARYKVTEFWDGRDENGYLVEDGRYPFTLVAYTTGTTKLYATDRVYGYIDVSRGKIVFLSFNITQDIATMQNSSGVVKLPPHMIEYSLSRNAFVTITVTDFDNGQIVAKIVDKASRDPLITYKDFWDGRCFNPSNPTVCKNGEWLIGLYNINVYAQDLHANPNKPIQITTVTMTVENYPFRLYDLAIAPLTPDSPAQISYQLSETMKVSIKIYKPGTLWINGEPVCAGGSGEESCLVNKIVGTRPGRTLITERWEGNIDITNSKAKSGIYVFKIIASTDSTLIDDATGDCIDGTDSCDVLRFVGDSSELYNISVTQGYVDKICDYFKNSYFAPNPMTSERGFFKVELPALSHFEVRVYDIIGEKVFEYNSRNYYPTGKGPRDRSYGYCISGNTASQDTSGCVHDSGLIFSKTNSFGKKLAPGIYYAVFKLLTNDGTNEKCQFRKKILIP